jgi:hypothetical protein
MIKITIDPKTNPADWPEQLIQQLELSGDNLSEQEKLVIRCANTSTFKAYGKLTARRIR